MTYSKIWQLENAVVCLFFSPSCRTDVESSQSIAASLQLFKMSLCLHEFSANSGHYFICLRRNFICEAIYVKLLCSCSKSNGNRMCMCEELYKDIGNLIGVHIC